MIDIHLHILPGVDDGPETMQESLDLARVLVQEGVHTAIATPHYNDEFPQRSATEIQERVNELQQELDRQCVPLCLLAGHEALIKPGLVEDIRTGRLATLNGSRYLLLELWNDIWPPETERVIFELLTYGIIPILAHPERYRAIQQDPMRLTPLLQQGVLTQLTISSLIGAQGKTARQCAENLHKNGLISCLASDAHGMQRRRPHIVQGLRCAERLLDQDQIHHLVEVQPGAIINNNKVSHPVPASRRKFFWRRK